MTSDLIIEKRTVTKYTPPVREFVEPNASDSFIYWLFRYRCVECKKPASEINEIEPRSRSKTNILNWKNRVPLCSECHRKYHDGGVSDKKADEMRKHRAEFLESTGRSEYIDGPTEVLST